MIIELLNVLRLVNEEVEEFINYLKTVDPELKQHEAALLAAALLKQLPTVIQSSPKLLKHVRESGSHIKQRVRS